MQKSPVWKLIGSIVLIISLGILVGLLASWLYLRNRIYPGVSVAGVAVGKLTQAQAQALLARYLEDNVPSAVSLRYQNNNWELSLGQIEFEPQIANTINKAASMRDLALFYNRSADLPLDFTVNAAKLHDFIATISAQLSFPVQQPEIIVENNRIQVMPGQDGQQLEEIKVIKLLQTRWSTLDFTPVVLPVEIIAIAVSPAQLENTRQRAGELFGKKLNVKVEEQIAALDGQQIVKLLSFAGGFERQKLETDIARLATSFNRPAVNAKFELQNGRVTLFEPAKLGIELNAEVAVLQLEDGLRQLEQSAEQELTIELRAERIAPEIANEQVNKLGIKVLLGRGESLFTGSAAGRIHNLALAASRINGTLVPAGTVFSFNQTAGDISAATGYQAAYIIRQGRTVLGDGGGVCQDSTTLFRAVLNAGLPIIERQPHSYRVVYYEKGGYQPGLDATVFAPTVDFKFLNDTPAHILIQARTDRKTNMLIYELYGTSDGRIATISNHRVWESVAPPEPFYQDDPTLPVGTVKQVDFPAWGAKTAFDYKVERNGEVIFDRTFYSHFRSWQAVYLRGTGG